jgi:hypothetical protein
MLLINKSKDKLIKWIGHPFAVPILLLFIAIVSYGFLINKLGYYWDDFPLAFIKNIYGSAGVEQYFSTNRPFWGVLYQISFNLLNQPLLWQINALVWRWLGAVILWLLLGEVWKQQKNIALWASLLFLVYPGFKQQHISIIYSSMFIVLDCFLLSLYLNIKSLHRPSDHKPNWKVWLLTGLALLLSLYNLLALEYFFTLELLRPLLIWFALSGENLDRRKRMKVTFTNWLPYLILWVLITIWRVFFFSFQMHNYQMLFFDNFRESPINAILTLVSDIGKSIWVVLVNAWIEVFKPPVIAQLGLRTTIVTLVLIFLSAVISILYLLLNRNNSDNRKKYGAVLFLGMAACLLGGVPWWLTALPPTLKFPSDRFTLPFILGVSLIIVGILGLLPIRLWMKSVILGILISFAVGSQFQVVNQFRRDWETQRRFFWQLAWRMPDIAPGTTVMMNDLPVTYYSDNSLTAPLNWFWAPLNNSQQMAYLLLYPSQRLGKSLESLNAGTPISVNYLAANFNGNTSQVISVYYDPPACVRVLDRALDSDNRMLSMDMQAAATLSSTEWINPDGRDANDILPDSLYAPQPPHGWCYYFERADLARQQGNWEEVAKLGDAAFDLNDYPNDPAERFPFIEGYAHVGKWDRAYELTEESISVTPMMGPLLCRLWQRIDASTSYDSKKESVLAKVNLRLGCSP